MDWVFCCFGWDNKMSWSFLLIVITFLTDSTIFLSASSKFIIIFLPLTLLLSSWLFFVYLIFLPFRFPSDYTEASPLNSMFCLSLEWVDSCLLAWSIFMYFSLLYSEESICLVETCLEESMTLMKKLSDDLLGYYREGYLFLVLFVQLNISSLLSSDIWAYTKWDPVFDSFYPYMIDDY